MSKRGLKDEEEREREEVPVDEDWIEGDTVVFKHSGRATSTVARRRCREGHVHSGSPEMPGGLLRCATHTHRGSTRANIQEREVLAGLTFAQLRPLLDMADNQRTPTADRPKGPRST